MCSTATNVEAGPRVHGIRNITSSAYVLRFDRNGLEFEPGQYVAVGLHGEIDMREYSIYSAPQDEFVEILVKEVAGGQVSRQLRQLTSGQQVAVDGPFGFFTIDEAARSGQPLLFIATGTGVSPFHCFAQSYPGLNYRLLHGVRTLEERYDHDVFDPRRVTTCVSRAEIDVAAGSRNSGGGVDGTGTEPLFQGRVTDYLREHPVAPETLCYLCGNCDMIYESFDILKTQGVAPEQLFAEVYF